MASLMRAEIDEIPEAVARFLARSGGAVAAAAGALARLGPRAVVTVARGSSDHVATLFKYAVELNLGVPVASVGPSVASVYGADLRLEGMACVAVSQSGRSPDIVALAEAAGRAGALTVAVTNDPGSPLAAACAHCVPLEAGPERSVAATKTFVASAVACLGILAAWRGDGGLSRALAGLPEGLAQAAAEMWEAPELVSASALYVIGRGPGWAVANEVALKFQEVCQILAASHSAAELQHGPVSLVRPGFPVLALAAADAAEAGVAETADALAAQGACVYATTDLARAAARLTAVRTGHGLTDPLALAVSAYGLVERVAQARGLDPDRPPHLSKVTRTV